jgi:hypothetical protein
MDEASTKQGAVSVAKSGTYPKRQVNSYTNRYVMSHILQLLTMFRQDRLSGPQQAGSQFANCIANCTSCERKNLLRAPVDSAINNDLRLVRPPQPG